MKKKYFRIILLLGVLVMIPSEALSQTKEDSFWNWFTNNSDKLYHFEKDQDRIFNELAAEMGKLDENLTFEFGPVVDGRRDFVISAAGIKASFPAVEALYNKKPETEKWNIIKFRPRRSIINSIQIQNLSIKPGDVKFLLFKDENPEKIGILLFLKGYSQPKRNIYGQIGYLFLDEVLGEYDVETYVGAIEFMGFDSKYFSQSLPIGELSTNFDRIFQK